MILYYGVDGIIIHCEISGEKFTISNSSIVLLDLVLE